MLILRVLQNGPLHGYAIAQRIHHLSGEVLEAEEGSLYPALQRLLMEGWDRGMGRFGDQAAGAVLKSDQGRTEANEA